VNENSPAPTEKKRVFLVDDHPLVRLGVRQLIDGQPDLEICGQADDAREALEGVARSKPDVVVMDLTVKSADGLDVLKRITTRFPNLPVLILSVQAESIFAELVLRAGARGYVMKSESLADVLSAIRRVIRGGVYLSDAMSAGVTARHRRGSRAGAMSPLDRLSERERQVLLLLGHWHTTRQAAQKLGLSVKTVEHYRERLKAKLSLDSAAALVQYAVQWAQQSGPGGPGASPPRGP
jgi:DNA-binding NarL/FixJ family response regulator